LAEGEFRVKVADPLAHASRRVECSTGTRDCRDGRETMVEAGADEDEAARLKVPVSMAVTAVPVSVSVSGFSWAASKTLAASIPHTSR
jgi:hypothetical protein